MYLPYLRPVFEVRVHYRRPNSARFGVQQKCVGTYIGIYENLKSRRARILNWLVTYASSFAIKRPRYKSRSKIVVVLVVL